MVRHRTFDVLLPNGPRVSIERLIKSIERLVRSDTHTERMTSGEQCCTVHHDTYRTFDPTIERSMKLSNVPQNPSNVLPTSKAPKQVLKLVKSLGHYKLYLAISPTPLKLTILGPRAQSPKKSHPGN
jgi:hypothetical protein